MVDGGEELGRVDRVLDGGGAGGVGFSVDVAALDAGTTDDGGVAVRQGVAAVGAVLIPTGQSAVLRSLQSGHRERPM